MQPNQVANRGEMQVEVTQGNFCARRAFRGRSGAKSTSMLPGFASQRTRRRAAACYLTHHKRMHDHIAMFEQVGKQNIAPAKMVDPRRCVDQDQLRVLWRRRGATLSSGWLLPRLARRLALSRSISALRPSCSKVERSRGPVSLIALANKLSSRFTVVRIRGLHAFAPMLASCDAGVDATESAVIESFVSGCQVSHASIQFDGSTRAVGSRLEKRRAARHEADARSP